MTVRHQAAIGILVSLAVIGAAIALQVWTLFFYPLDGPALLLAPVLIGLMCWLYVGLFIVAHDAMHGSLAPNRPLVNLWIGRIALAAYAGFSFDRLRAKHFDHHGAPGTAGDPDFSTAHPRHFWPWYGRFLRQYFGLRQLLVLTGMAAAYLLLGAALPNMLLFWAVPSILSSMQLFYFGTYRPHRLEDESFLDDHRARSSNFGFWASLFSCFHFGYHHEHHLAPHVPWWRLPAERQQRALAR